jgi:hypothetical protein
MQFSLAFAVAAMASIASAGMSSNVTYTTVIVDTFTTVCPEATSLTFNGVTYTVTAVSRADSKDRKKEANFALYSPRL